MGFEPMDRKDEACRGHPPIYLRTLRPLGHPFRLTTDHALPPPAWHVHLRSIGPAQNAASPAGRPTSRAKALSVCRVAVLARI